MSIIAPESTCLPKVIQQNNVDLKEIQTDNIFQMLRAAEEIGKRKQFFEDNGRLLISESHRLTQEIHQIEQFIQADWEARFIPLLPKIDAVYAKAIALVKCYSLQIKDEAGMEALKRYPTYKSGELYAKHQCSKTYSAQFEQIAKQIQQAQANLISDGKSFKIQNLHTVSQQAISHPSQSQLNNNANSYFLQSRQFLAVLEAQNTHLQKEIDSLNLQKQALQKVQADLPVLFKAAIIKHFTHVHLSVQNVYNDTHQIYLDLQKKIPQLETDNPFLRNEIFVTYKMAGAAGQSAFHIAYQIDEILKEGA